MSLKRKGTKFERELFHMFWKNNFAAVRSAGSGSTPMPAPDLLVGNKEKLLAIECKAGKKKSKEFKKEEIQQLKQFSETINAAPILAMRFNRKGWFFIDASELKENKYKSYNLSLNHCQKEGITFKELIGEYKQNKL